MAHAPESRGLRDEMNVGPDPRAARHLLPLSELKHFKVADGEPDIRGWEVYTSAGRHIGDVDDLLVDTSTNEVVMVDVDLKRDDRHTLAPIRAAWVDQSTKRVVIDAKEVTTGDELPSYVPHRAVTDEEARRFDERYDRAYGERGYLEEDYAVRRSNAGLRFGRRDADRPVDRSVDRPADADVAPADRMASEAPPPRRSSRVERYSGSAEDDRIRDEEAAQERSIRYGQRAEPRPVVEEVVVRRREMDAAELDDSLLRPRPDAGAPPDPTPRPDPESRA